MDKPFLSVVNANDLKDKLDIQLRCYGLPSICLKHVDGKLQMTYQLTNKTEKKYIIDTRDNLYYSQNVAIRLNSKTLFRMLEIFNYKKITMLGYKKAKLYLENSKVTVILSCQEI